MKSLRKIMVLALVMQLGTLMVSTQVYAQTKKSDPVVVKKVEADKVEIKKEELLEATKTVLASNELKDWIVTKAYKVKMKEKDANGKELFEYEVELTKADQKQVLMFDKDGNLKPQEG